MFVYQWIQTVRRLVGRVPLGSLLIVRSQDYDDLRKKANLSDRAAKEKESAIEWQQQFARVAQLKQAVDDAAKLFAEMANAEDYGQLREGADEKEDGHNLRSTLGERKRCSLLSISISASHI